MWLFLKLIQFYFNLKVIELVQTKMWSMIVLWKLRLWTIRETNWLYFLKFMKKAYRHLVNNKLSSAFKNEIVSEVCKPLTHFLFQVYSAWTFYSLIFFNKLQRDCNWLEKKGNLKVNVIEKNRNQFKQGIKILRRIIFLQCLLYVVKD